MKLFQKRFIPNYLSILRFFMIPVFIVLFFKEDIPNNRIYAVAVFMLAWLTDMADGYLARKNNWITVVGKLIDPLADKMMQISAFICIAIRTKAGIFLAALICVKDLLLILGSIVLAKKGAIASVGAKWYGKMNTVVLACTLCVMILWWENSTLTYIMLGISAVTIIFALIMYTSNVFVKYIKNEKNDRSKVK